MKTSITLIAVFLMSATALADYSLPRNPNTNRPPANAGQTSIPRSPHAGGAQPSVGIGRHEKLQFLIATVLKQAAVKSDRMETWAHTLFSLAQKEKDVEAYLSELIAYFDSAEFKSLSADKQAQAQSEARILLEMTMSHYPQ